MKQTNLEWLLTLKMEAAGKAADKFSEISCNGNSSDYNYCEYLRWLQEEHTEPIVLTAEERKAAELAVAIGLPWITRINNATVLSEERLNSSIGVKACYVPAFHSLCDFGGNVHPEWITPEPIDLRELLKEGTI